MPDLDLIKQGEQAVRRPHQGLVPPIEVEADGGFSRYAFGNLLFASAGASRGPYQDTPGRRSGTTPARG